MFSSHHILRSDSVEGLLRSQEALLASLPGLRPVFRRWFLSDPSQKAEISPSGDCAEAFIVQPPLDGSAAGLWIWLVGDAEVGFEDGATFIREGECTHILTAGAESRAEGSERQTAAILKDYESFLAGKGLGIGENCVRTWFFCHDIDNNYAGLVKGRRENFLVEGLTPQTHYIASTGIAGTPVDPENLVQMDAWAIDGPFRQRYLYAPTHLNPTYEYGVTFERGVTFDCGGKSTTLISGTASINNKGEVMHIGDPVAQTGRMLENVEALLAEAGAAWTDVKMALVYLRNAADYAKVAPLLSEKLGATPYIILLAPVCRPDWLIEMECIAIR